MLCILRVFMFMSLYLLLMWFVSCLSSVLMLMFMLYLYSFRSQFSVVGGILFTDSVMFNNTSRATQIANVIDPRLKRSRWLADTLRSWPTCLSRTLTDNGTPHEGSWFRALASSSASRTSRGGTAARTPTHRPVSLEAFGEKQSRTLPVRLPDAALGAYLSNFI